MEFYNGQKAQWGILCNKGNVNGRAALVKEYKMNVYDRVSDLYGVERHQSVPLYELSDTIAPLRYGRDGSLVRILEIGDTFARLENVNIRGEWLVPIQYVKIIQPVIF